MIFRSVITTATTSKYPQQYHNIEDKVNKLARATENNGHGNMFTGNCLLSTAMNISWNTLLETPRRAVHANLPVIPTMIAWVWPFQLCRSSQGGLDLEIKALKLESIFGADLDFILLNVWFSISIQGNFLTIT